MSKASRRHRHAYWLRRARRRSLKRINGSMSLRSSSLAIRDQNLRTSTDFYPRSFSPFGTSYSRRAQDSYLSSCENIDFGKSKTLPFQRRSWVMASSVSLTSGYRSSRKANTESVFSPPVPGLPFPYGETSTRQVVCPSPVVAHHQSNQSNPAGEAAGNDNSFHAKQPTSRQPLGTPRQSDASNGPCGEDTASLDVPAVLRDSTAMSSSYQVFEAPQAADPFFEWGPIDVDTWWPNAEASDLPGRLDHVIDLLGSGAITESSTGGIS